MQWLRLELAGRKCDDRCLRQPPWCRRFGPPAINRLSQLGARARPFRSADLPDGGDRPAGRLSALLQRIDCAIECGLCRLWRVFAAGWLARRPLEPPQHDGGLLYRLRSVAGRRGFRTESRGASGSDVRARRVRSDLSSGWHGDADRGIECPWTHARLQRRVRESWCLACCWYQRRACHLVWLARCLLRASGGPGRHWDILSLAHAR